MNSRIYIPYTPSYGPVSVTYSKLEDPGFEYKHRKIQPKKKELTDFETDTHRVWYLRFPSVGVNGQDGNTVTAWYYQSKLPGEKKLVIVLPIWGSYKYPSWTITQGIVGHSRGDINVIMVLGEKYLLDWDAMREAPDEATFINVMKGAVQRVRTMVTDIRRLIDWADMQPDVNGRRVGLVGFSLGALIAGVTLVHEPRIEVGVLVMGGANPGEILTTCAGRPASVRDAAMQRFGWTIEQYRNLVTRIFAPVNPAEYAGRVDPHRVIMFDAYYDDCIPKTAREALWDTMGHPERISFLYTHKMSFLSMTPLGSNYMRGKIYEFLDKVL